MKTGICTTVPSAVALALALMIVPATHAQMGDVVKVNMPYTVTLGEKTLAPGDYEIRQLRDLGGGSRILLIYSDSGMKFETMAMTIPTLDLKTPEDTKVILSHIGNDYYFDKIWVQGKNYGYEFALPKSVRDRETEATSVAASTGASSFKTDTTTTDTTTNTAVAANTPPVENTEPVKTEPVTQVAPEPAPTPVPEVAAAPPAPTPVPEPQVEPQPATSGDADREEMPATSAGWLPLLLASGCLFGTGFALRRKA